MERFYWLRSHFNDGVINEIHFFSLLIEKEVSLAPLLKKPSNFRAYRDETFFMYSIKQKSLYIYNLYGLLWS
ncbi:MAG: hypothetical protein BAJALOKI1v1_750013 [Promethearchaeota archaeon]|nr:MAG: hypothetical protein BAJALOKI1v1_750013 [Candidatus Lokiarchaeota archaeon]